MISRPLLVAAAAVALSTSACVIEGDEFNLEGQTVRLTLLHTTDIHSRLTPYRFTPPATDQGLGIEQGTAENPAPGFGIGGIERIAYIIARERALTQRSLVLDSGDSFQGAPIFNLWHGEPEYRTLAALGMSAVVMGNHDFDAGAENYSNMVERWGNFPVLAANYEFEDPTKPWANTLGRTSQPWTIVNVKGLRVGIIGMGDIETLTSITEQGNSLGIVPIASDVAAQHAVDQLRPITDVIVVLSHLGLSGDTWLAENVRGIDVILGGHLHIVLWPPKTVTDPDGRQVIIAHSGAFAKYVGRLDLALRKPDDAAAAAQFGWEVVSHKYKVFPVDRAVQVEMDSTDKAPHQVAAMDAARQVREILEPYLIEMSYALDLKRTVGCYRAYYTDGAEVDTNLRTIKRFGMTNGDSPLGNIVAESLQTHERVQADFAITNSPGIRDDLRGRKYEGDAMSDPHACLDENGKVAFAISLEELYNVLPFENYITTMFLSGAEVQELFDYIAWRTSQRSCSTQAHISGATVTLVCSGDDDRAGPHADDVTIGGAPLNLGATYELATNDYLATGGSGYDVLKRNTTQYNTYISMRDAVSEYLARTGMVPCSNSDPKFTQCGQMIPSAGIEDGRIKVRF